MTEMQRDNIEMYRRMVANLPVILFDAPVGSDQGEFFVSPQIRELFGTCPENFTVFTEVFYNALHEDDRDQVIAEWESACQEKKSYSLECRLRSTKGPVWLLNEGAFVFDVSGKPIRHSGVLIDITLRKSRENGLRESEERYRKIAETMSDYVFTVRVENGKVVETVHGGACQPITGYSPSDFERNPNLWIEMVHEHDRDMIASRAMRMLRGEDVEQVEHRITHRNGQVRWVHSTVVPHRDNNGRVLSFDGVIRDITEQKKTEQIEQQRSYVNELLLDSIPFTAVLLQEDGEVIAANSAGLAMGFAPGHAWSSVWDEISCACECASFLEKAMNSESRQQTEVRHRGRYYEATFVPMEPDLCLCCFYDITERKEFEEALNDDKLLIKAIMENTVTSIFILDPDGKFETINIVASRMLDMSPAEIAGLTLFEVFPRQVAAIRQEKVREAVAKRSHIRMQEEIARRIYDTMIFPVTDDDGNACKVAIFSRDLTEQLRSEANLLEAYQTLTTLVERSPVAIITLDLQGVVKSWNPAGEKMFGWHPSEVCGKKITLFGDPPPAELMAAWEGSCKGTEMVERMKAQACCKDGQCLQAYITGSPMMDAAGQINGIILIVEDK